VAFLPFIWSIRAASEQWLGTIDAAEELYAAKTAHIDDLLRRKQGKGCFRVELF
jgi:hypothetical protein